MYYIHRFKSLVQGFSQTLTKSRYRYLYDGPILACNISQPIHQSGPAIDCIIPKTTLSYQETISWNGKKTQKPSFAAVSDRSTMPDWIIHTPKCLKIWAISPCQPSAASFTLLWGRAILTFVSLPLMKAVVCVARRGCSPWFGPPRRMSATAFSTWSLCGCCVRLRADEQQLKICCSVLLLRHWGHGGD